MTDRCIFCKLIRSKENILYEDSHLFIVADVFPLTQGHILLIPKEHAEFLHDLSEDVLLRILPTVKKVVNLLNYKKYNILQNNMHMQSVPHVHFHIIPATEDRSLIIRWETMKVTSSYLEKLRKDIREALS